MDPDIRQFYLFSKVSEAGLVAFLKGSRARVFADNDVIYDVGDEPDCVYVVLEGAVRIEVPLPEGDSLFLGVAPAATLLGDHEALCHTYSVARIAAVGDARVLCVPRENFLHLFKSEPEFTQLLAQQFAMTMRMMCLAAAHHFNSRAD
ncbi:MAG: cyclic nucleotide-binding domain-containing protein, partial [Ketobacteraceae bacterium]|nr:cyclic nucleotide-binding domain-containing protein [Ketobacteraceae bacterium]